MANSQTLSPVQAAFNAIPARSPDYIHRIDEGGRTAVLEHRALAKHCLLTGGTDAALDVEAAISDTLTNFMHMCDGLDLDFEYLLTNARMHHREECSEADEQGGE